MASGGPTLKALSEAYASNATFRGRVTDAELESLYSRARASWCRTFEEFGIAAVEAQSAAGR